MSNGKVGLTKVEIRTYIKTYPELTKGSVLKVMRQLKQKHGVLSSITMDYHLRPKKFGGLGKGKFKKRRWKR